MENQWNPNNLRSIPVMLSIFHFALLIPVRFANWKTERIRSPLSISSLARQMNRRQERRPSGGNDFCNAQIFSDVTYRFVWTDDLWETNREEIVTIFDGWETINWMKSYAPRAVTSVVWWLLLVQFFDPFHVLSYFQSSGEQNVLLLTL